MSDADVERAVLYALGNPPPFEGDLDDPWFSEGPVPTAAIAERLESLDEAESRDVEPALDRLEAGGFVRRRVPGGPDDPGGGGVPGDRGDGEGDGDGEDRFDTAWELTDRGAAEAERLPDRYLADRRTREPRTVDANDECEYLSLLHLG